MPKPQPDAAPGPSDGFVRSTFCQGALACVEVAKVGNEVLVRDGKDTSVLPLRFSVEEWRLFLAQQREEA